jgi:hypothetical protein
VELVDAERGRVAPGYAVDEDAGQDLRPGHEAAVRRLEGGLDPDQVGIARFFFRVVGDGRVVDCLGPGMDGWRRFLRVTVDGHA